MSDVIKLLPDSVANQIAAGEVIQRPASVVKELVENAVDAGATNIKIILKDAGRTLIQVVDNGVGMTPTDARLAFERHSTSKITAAADLFDLHTMGFRGEALASICAVAQVELITMPKDYTIGTRIVISGSKVEIQEPAASAPGSNMMVKNLFFNVPARRKFLKKDSVELSNIIHEFERLTLVNPGIDFELYHNDSLIHQLIHGSLKQRIAQLYGKSVERQLIPIDVDTSLVKITGFIGLPEHARRRGALQFFFVNGRHMRHPYFHKAVMSCYEPLIPVDSNPNYFLNFTIDPSTIDVNIHPTKNEIKFENEQPVWQILAAAVRESLGKFNAVPSIDFDVDDRPDIPSFNPNSNASHDVELDTSYNPFNPPTTTAKSKSVGWEKLYDDGFAPSTAVGLKGSSMNGLTADVPDSNEPAIVESRLSGGGFDSAPVETGSVMQLKDRYILSPAKSGLMVIDQHRAHVLVLYEKYLKQLKEHGAGSQKLIFPEVVSLTAARNIILDSIIDDIAELGFDLSFLGDNSWAINGVPSLIGNLNPVDTLIKMIDNVDEGGFPDGTEISRRVALAMARASAIQGGTPLTPVEMESLMNDLFMLPAPSFTPDGLPVVVIIGVDEISSKLS